MLFICAMEVKIKMYDAILEVISFSMHFGNCGIKEMRKYQFKMKYILHKFEHFHSCDHIPNIVSFCIEGLSVCTIKILSYIDCSSSDNILDLSSISNFYDQYKNHKNNRWIT